MLRNRIILVQGKRFIAELITVSEYSRLNIDRIILVTALRYPEFLPPELNPTNPSQLLDHITDVFAQFDLLGQTHLISAEYAEAIIRRQSEVFVIEGVGMNIPWVYNTIRALHKNLGQCIVDVRTGTEQIFINGTNHPWEDGLSWLKLQSFD